MSATTHILPFAGDRKQHEGPAPTKVGTSYTETARGEFTYVGMPPASLRATSTGTNRQYSDPAIQKTDTCNVAIKDPRFQKPGGRKRGGVIDTHITCPVDGSIQATFTFPQPACHTQRRPIQSVESNSESINHALSQSHHEQLCDVAVGIAPQDSQGHGEASIGAASLNGYRQASVTHVPSTPLSVSSRINQDASSLTGKIRGATSSYRKKVYPLAPPPKPRLSMSKTTTVLTNLKSSLPRVSLSSSERKHSITSIISKSSNKESITHSAAETSQISIGLDQTDESNPDLKESESESEDPSIISHAHESSYWVGRYVGLNDRLLTQTRLSKQSMKEAFDLKASARPDRNRNVFKGSIPHSNTTAALTTLPTIRSASSTPTQTPVSAAQSTSTLDFHVPPGQDEADARFLFIMEHLRKLCVTPQARESLWIWQQAYARKERKAGLLPPGGSMTDLQLAKSGGVLSRFLGGQSLIARARKTDGKHTPPGRPLGARADLSGKVGSKNRLNLFRAKMPNLG